MKNTSITSHEAINMEAKNIDSIICNVKYEINIILRVISGLTELNSHRGSYETLRVHRKLNNIFNQSAVILHKMSNSNRSTINALGKIYIRKPDN